MIDMTDGGAVALRAFVDGKPTPAMLQERERSMAALTPGSAGRWPGCHEGRLALARAAWMSGYDTACIAATRQEHVPDAVQEGLAQAAAGELVDGPDLGGNGDGNE